MQPGTVAGIHSVLSISETSHAPFRLNRRGAVEMAALQTETTGCHAQIAPAAIEVVIKNCRLVILFPISLRPPDDAPELFSAGNHTRYVGETVWIVR